SLSSFPFKKRTNPLKSVAFSWKPEQYWGTLTTIWPRVSKVSKAFHGKARTKRLRLTWYWPHVLVLQRNARIRSAIVLNGCSPQEFDVSHCRGSERRSGRHRFYFSPSNHCGAFPRRYDIRQRYICCSIPGAQMQS